MKETLIKKRIIWGDVWSWVAHLAQVFVWAWMVMNLSNKRVGFLNFGMSHWEIVGTSLLAQAVLITVGTRKWWHRPSSCADYFCLQLFQLLGFVLVMTVMLLLKIRYVINRENDDALKSSEIEFGWTCPDMVGWIKLSKTMGGISANRMVELCLLE